MAAFTGRYQALLSLSVLQDGGPAAGPLQGAQHELYQGTPRHRHQLHHLRLCQAGHTVDTAPHTPPQSLIVAVPAQHDGGWGLECRREGKKINIFISF